MTTASVPSEPTRSLLRSGPGGRARHRAQAQDLTVRQDRGQPEQQVLDRAEPRRGLPGRRGRDPAADGGDRDRLRIVARGQAVCGQFLFEPVAAHAGLDLDRLGDRVDGADPVHPGQVEHDRLGLGLGAAADARACAPRDDRGARLAGPGQDGRDLFGAGREDHRGGFGQVVAADPAEQRQRPGVDRVVAQGLPVGADGAVGQRPARISRELTRGIVDRGPPGRPGQRSAATPVHSSPSQRTDTSDDPAGTATM